MKKQKNPLSLAFDLGNIYLEANKKKLNEFKDKLSKENIVCIWNKINEKKPNYEKLKGYAKPIECLKKEMIKDKFYLEKISNASIVSFGKDPKWSVFALEALIKKNASAELPMKAILALGEDNEIVAKIILENLKNKKKLKYKMGYYEISAKWAKDYPRLRKEIATTWQNYFALYPMTTKEHVFLEKALIELKKDYSEFKNVNLNARQSRDSGPVNCQYNSKNASHFFMMLSLGTTLIGGGIFLGSIGLPILFYMRTKAIALGAAVFSSGISYASSNR